jgi:hypothetical protein
MKYKVISYEKAQRAHRVEDSEGHYRLVDLMVSGDFPEDTQPEDLVGKTFKAKREFPFIAIAEGVKEVIQ